MNTIAEKLQLKSYNEDYDYQKLPDEYLIALGGTEIHINDQLKYTLWGFVDESLLEVGNDYAMVIY